MTQHTGPCQVCGTGMITVGDRGKLVDHNGHVWWLCKECIDSLWHDRQQMNQEKRFKGDAIEWAVERIRTLLGQEED